MGTRQASREEKELRWDAINKALVVDTRRWVLIAIAECEVCAADLARLLGSDRPSMSKLLKPLKQTGILVELVQRDRKLLRLTEIVRVTRNDDKVQIVINLSDGFQTNLQFPLHKQLVRCFDEFGARYPKNAAHVEPKPSPNGSGRNGTPIGEAHAPPSRARRGRPRA